MLGQLLVNELEAEELELLKSQLVLLLLVSESQCQAVAVLERTPEELLHLALADPEKVVFPVALERLADRDVDARHNPKHNGRMAFRIQ